MRITEQLIEEISNNTYKDEALILSGLNIHYEDMSKLVGAIKLNNYIKRINLGEIESIDKESIALLASLENIECIFAVYTRIDDSDAKILLTSKAPTIILDSNCLTEACLEGIEDNKTLRELSLSANRITDKGVAILAGNQSIEKLDLSQCRLHDGCAPYLASMKSLKKLDLSSNMITDAGFKVLYDSDIEEISLGYGKKITPERFKERSKEILQKKEHIQLKEQVQPKKYVQQTLTFGANKQCREERVAGDRFASPAKKLKGSFSVVKQRF